MKLKDAGLKVVILFGLPEHKDKWELKLMMIMELFKRLLEKLREL